MTDFHTHILPGMDDGAADAAMSLELLRQEAAQGISRVILTPHFYPYEEAPDQFLSRRNAAEKALKEALPKEEALPGLTVGAEVYFFRGMSQSEELGKLVIRGTRAILIEMPPAPWETGIFRELEEIWERWNLIPVIAHIDRYIAPFRTFGIPERLAELHVLVQANASFFLNWQTAPLALRMLKKKQIHLLGSDCHNLTSRKPNLAQALEKIRRKLGQNTVEVLNATASEILGLEQCPHKNEMELRL